MHQRGCDLFEYFQFWFWWLLCISVIHKIHTASVLSGFPKHVQPSWFLSFQIIFYHYRGYPSRLVAVVVILTFPKFWKLKVKQESVQSTPGHAEVIAGLWQAHTVGISLSLLGLGPGVKAAALAEAIRGFQHQLHQYEEAKIHMNLNPWGSCGVAAP